MLANRDNIITQLPAGLDGPVVRDTLTQLEYEAFRDDGYTRREWWSEAGWAWRREPRATEPRLWHDGGWNAPNRPVVGVGHRHLEAVIGDPVGAIRVWREIPVCSQSRSTSAPNASGFTTP